MALHHILPILSAGKLSPMAAMPFLATVVPEDSPIILSGVLLTLVVIYLASKIGAEAAKRFDFPPVLGELVAGVVGLNHRFGHSGRMACLISKVSSMRDRALRHLVQMNYSVNGQS